MIIVIMGVAGSGKTTIGTRLAAELGWPYAEGDDFHPPGNVAKMAAGTPLTDADREPWLRAIGGWIDDRRAGAGNGVVACSALKHAYREMLAHGRPDVRFILLAGGRDTIAQRLAARPGHFMKAGMLDSQLATFEPPVPDEHVITVSVDGTPEQIIAEIRRALNA